MPCAKTDSCLAGPLVRIWMSDKELEQSRMDRTAERDGSGSRRSTTAPPPSPPPPCSAAADDSRRDGALYLSPLAMEF